MGKDCCSSRVFLTQANLVADTGGVTTSGDGLTVEDGEAEEGDMEEVWGNPILALDNDEDGSIAWRTVDESDATLINNGPRLGVTLLPSSSTTSKRLLATTKSEAFSLCLIASLSFCPTIPEI